MTSIRLASPHLAEQRSNVLTCENPVSEGGSTPLPHIAA